MSPQHDAAALLRGRVDQHLRSLRLDLAIVNAVACVALAINQAGASPAFRLLEQYAPLPVWAVGFGAVALLLALAMLDVRTNVAGHLCAAVLWMFPAIGAAYGLVGGTTTSPTASLVFSALISGICAHHVRALVFLRRMARRSKQGGATGVAGADTGSGCP